MTFLAVLVLLLSADPHITLAQAGGKAKPVSSQEHAQISSLIRQNHLDQAEQQLWDVLTKQPHQPWAFDLLAEIRERQKRGPEAEALFQKALALNGRDLDALRGLGDAYRADGKADQAIASYQQALAIAPGDRASMVALAALYTQANEYQKSLDALHCEYPHLPKSGTCGAPQWPDALPLLAEDYFGLKQPEKVAPLIRSAVRLGSDHPQMVLDFVVVLLKNGYVDDASHLIEFAKTSKPSAEYLRTLARVRAAQGKPPEAQKLIAQALQLEPKSFDLLFDAAGLAARQNQWSETVDYLRRADEVRPDQADVLTKLALALLRLKQNLAAVAVARHLDEIQPDNFDNEYVLAFALSTADRDKDAEPVAKKMVEQRPKELNGLLMLSILEYKNDEFSASRQDLNRCLAVDPKSADAHYYLGLLDQKAGDLDSARAQLEQAVSAKPELAPAQALLGELYLQAGNAEGARTALERAVKLNPENSQDHYQLALVYNRLGLREQARSEMTTYQKLRQAEDAARKKTMPGAQTGANPQGPR